jgi:PAS domain-containing protein
MSSILEQYYRQPEIYITIPNNGEFYPPGVLEIPESGEIPIYAMTAKDDIILRTPDALISGEAVAQLIKSCVPSIKDPWQIPASDIDYILVAIRIASYGNEMELEFKCEKCENEFNYEIGLGHYIEKLGEISFSEENKVISYGDIKIHIKPLSYTDLTFIQRRTFEEQRALQAVNQMEDRTDEEKTKFYNEILNTMTDININSIASGVKGIELPDGILITDKEEIVSFVNNASIKLFRKISTTISAARQKTVLEPLHIECPECEHKFDSPLIFDYANFFV